MAESIDISGRVSVDNRAAGPLGGIADSIRKIGENAQRASQPFAKMMNMGAMGGVSNNLRNVAGQVGKLGASVMRVAAPLAALAGAAGFAGITVEMNNYIKKADELAKTSLKTGVSVEQLQDLRLAAELAGVSTESLDGSIGMLNRKLTEVAAGKNKDLPAMFKRLGISMRDSKGNMRSAADLMPQLAAAMKKNTDQTARNTIASTAFGKSGAEMIKLLAGGPEAFANATAEMDRLGRITTAQAQQAEAAADAQLLFGKAIEGVRNAIAANLLPSITPVIKHMGDWIALNRDWIAGGIETAVKKLAEGFKLIPWETIGTGLKDMITPLGEILSKIGGWEAVFPVVAGILAGVVVKAIWGVTAAVGKLTIALLTNPIVLVVAAIAASAYLLWKHWDTVSAFFTKLWKDVKGAFDAVVDWLGPWGNLFLPLAIYKNWDEIVAFFTALWPKVKAAFWVAVGWVESFAGLFTWNGISAAWDGLTGWFTGLWERVKAPFVAAGTWLAGVLDTYTPEPIKQAWNALGGFFERMWKTVENAFDAAWKFIKPIIDKIMAAIGPLISAVESIGAAANKVKDVAGGAISATTGAIGDAASAVADTGKKAASTVGGWGSSLYDAGANLFSGKKGTGTPGAVMPTSNPVQAAGPAAPVARVDGEVNAKIKIEAGPGLLATATTQDKGRVSSDVDVGRSMVPA